MKVVHAAAAAGLAFALCGCATAIRGTKQDFIVASTPPGATATLSTGQTCVTLCTLELPRKNPFDVTVTLEGHDPVTTHVGSGWSRGGTQTFVVGNLIFGGLIGMGIDASNGATRDLFPNPVEVTLAPALPPAPLADAAPAEAASIEASVETPAAQ